MNQRCLYWLRLKLATVVTLAVAVVADEDVATLPLQLFLPSLVVLLCGVQSHSVDSIPTYEYKDPSTGETISCNKCSPGTHMSAHCTFSTPTRCAPCRWNHFTELWNYLPKCLYCNNFCTDDQEVETECSPRNNRVCRCKEGFYLSEDYCHRHSKCAHGQGVLIRGTPQNDTVCQRCSVGFFSESSSALEECVKHKECVNGKLVLLPGSVSHDTVCGLCEELANGGETLRTFLSGFFSMHRMRAVKMRRFVHKYINRLSKGKQIIRVGFALQQQRGHLLDQIKGWLHQAPKEQLEKLPHILRTTQLSSMVDKLDKRLREIEQQTPNCSLSHVFSFN
ncbi:tumor necrosis factor receptor superfamily member 6B-like [Dunckerocampus dactyliophorus]|uniref:tumor necrosis factor receptor superfamily member 6B-like n=1 Tax=Dunckerocampus dactyliophorus TaxID=161453 RepID=UPI0024062D87|nr:tumor necrosis factor receptor superfamily member 6B-like [Dunckerocampus dactyliophorus]